MGVLPGGLDDLFQAITDFVQRDDVEAVLQVPFARGEVIARLHQQAHILDTEHNAEGTRLRVRMPSALAAALSDLTIDEGSAG